MLLDWAAGLVLLGVAVHWGQAVRCRRSDVGDLFGVGVLAADLGDTNVSCLAGFGEGVVATVEVLALLIALSVCYKEACASPYETHLELVLEQVLLVGELAVEAEQLGFLFGHFLCLIVRSRLFKISRCTPEAASQGERCCAGATNDVR
jgi:hypothetical protein